MFACDHDVLRKVKRSLRTSTVSHVPHFKVSDKPRFGYVNFPLWFGEVRRVLGFFLFCYAGTPRNQWTSAQFGGVALAHARTKNSGRMRILKSPLPVSKGFNKKKTVDQCTFSRARAEFSTRLHRKSQQVGLWNYRRLYKGLNTKTQSTFRRGLSRGLCTSGRA